MANYAVADSVTDPCYGLDALAVAMETLVQAVDATKAIYYIDIVKLHDNNMWQGVLIAQS